MNSFYSIDELKNLGLKTFGDNVLISRNTQIYNPETTSIGNNVRIDDFCILSGNIKLGSYIHISAYCGLYGKFGIVMNDFTGLSPRCTVFSASDNFNGEYLMSPMTKKKHWKIQKSVILIDKYSQVGANTVILPNSILNEGVAVGALSLVNKELEPWSIYAGVPVKKIKPRSKTLLNFINDYE